MTNAILLVLVFEGACLAYFIRGYIIGKNIHNLIIAVLLLIIFVQPFILSALDITNLIDNKTENIPTLVKFLATLASACKLALLISAACLYRIKKTEGQNNAGG